MDGFFQLLNGIAMGDQRRGLNPAGIDQIHGFLMGIGIDEGAADFQFLLEYIKQGHIEFSIGIGHAKEQNPPAAISAVMAARARNDIFAFIDQRPLVCAFPVTSSVGSG